MGRDRFSRSADLQYPERCVAGGVVARVALPGLRGRGGPMVAPTGFGPTAVGKEGRPGLSRAAPSTAWVDTVGNAKRTAGHWPFSLRGHVLVSIERDVRQSLKRLWV